MARAYALGIGFLLFVVGILGFIKSHMFGLNFSPLHNFIHLGSGAIGLASGLSVRGTGAKTYAQVFGVVYTVIAIAGFAGTPDFVISMLNLNTSYNVIHVTVGALGLVVGFTGANLATV